jgi:Tfp pilus assembly protein PilV
MNLVEVLVAAVVFAGACGGSVQIVATSVGSLQRAVGQQGQMDGIDQDLLQLQARWRQEAAKNQPFSPCTAALAPMAEVAAQQPVPAGVSRDLRPTADGLGLELISRVQNATVERHRLFSPAGFGFCRLEGQG